MESRGLPSSVARQFSNSMLPLLLVIAQPLAAASASLRLTSTMQTENLGRRLLAGRSAPDVCFIHVGKTGGDSVSKMLHDAMDRGEFASFMETHDDGIQTPQSWDHCKWYGGLRPSQCEGDAIDKGPVAKQLHFHEQCGNCFLHACTATGHMVMWVRDPVSRLISIWNADSSYTLAGKGKEVLSTASALGLPISEDQDGARFVDLGQALHHLASRDDPISSMRNLLASDSHIEHDTNWYMGAESPDDVSTCKTLAAKLNFACVGRVERFADDWARCWSNGLGMAADQTPQVEHTHQMSKAGKELSPESVQLARKFFANELECLKALHAEGHIPSDGWMEEVLSDTKVYMY